jgi:hypothetical protein
MATKKKVKKKRKALRKTSAKDTRPVKAARKKLTKKKASPKKLTKNRRSSKKSVVKTKAPGKTKTKTAAKTTRVARAQVLRRSQSLDAEAFAAPGFRARSAGQSGDLQGLSNLEGADSESVDELIEEGNAFEADVVAGVESADNTREVRTHEVPEDDVPGEYLDEE